MSTPIHPASSPVPSTGGSLLPDVRLPDPYLPARGDASYQAESYELELDYRVSSNRLSGITRMYAVAREEISRLEMDLHRSMQVSKVLVAGKRPARFSRSGDRLSIKLTAPIPAEQGVQVTVHYSGNPGPQMGTWGDVGWEELTDGALVAGQPDGASTWFPCNDHPSQKARFDITVTCDSPFTVVANGLCRATRRGGSRTTWVYEQAEPISTYLATVQIGPYKTWRLDTEVTEVPILVAGPAQHERAIAADLARQGEMVALFERLFGPYPYAQYTVVVTDDALEIPLEAGGASIFGRNHLDGDASEERLVAHELAHQWFGNCLSLAGWRHMWLNEGFACYSEWLWDEQRGRRTADASARYYRGSLARRPRDLVLADPSPELMFDDRVYKRGACTLHALRLELGDGSFFDMLAAWVREHRHGVVDTAMFAEHVQRYTSNDLVPLLEAWLFRTDLPTFPPR